MPHLLTVFSLAMVVTFSAPVSSASFVRQAPSDADNRERMPLTPGHRIAEEDVRRTYEELQAKPGRQRVQRLAEMPSDMQSAVWIHHLIKLLGEHPEFTTDQRVLIQEGLSLLTPDLRTLVLPRHGPGFTV